MVTADYHGTAYVQGTASGKLIASDIELSFWGGVNPWSGEITDRYHPLSGQFLQGTILAVPGGRGSCSGSGVILELLLNDKGPNALIFERREDILTLGVMIAEEVFGKTIPVVTVNPMEFKNILSLKGQLLHVLNGRVSSGELASPGASPSSNDDKGQLTGRRAVNVQLSDVDRAFLKGTFGEATRISMRIVIRMAELLGARELMDVSQVHVDGCVYTGPGSLAFAEKLRDWGGKVRVPTSLNSISIDQKHWRTQGMQSAFGEAAERLAIAYMDMGANPTFTCAPYQLESAPKFGEQIAWAESNAVVYANSVLGARTMKYPDFLDISIALTGRAPKGGTHTDNNRLASVIVKVLNIPSVNTIDEAIYPLLGYHVGTIASSRIPVVVGLESLTPSKDDLKAFGAAFATVSSSPMFHIVGITPEAPVLDVAIDKTHFPPSVEFELRELYPHWDKLNSASDDQLVVDLVSLGNPHFSFAEITRLAELCNGRHKKQGVKVIVTCGRATYGLASEAGLLEQLEKFGVQFMTDTCWCMISEPTIPRSTAAIMTNSAKYAHYGPGLTGRKFYFGSLAGCVDAACESIYGRAVPTWLLNYDE
jgi:predicted aconitase/predicted aconitase with swiveling domain